MRVRAGKPREITNSDHIGHLAMRALRSMLTLANHVERHHDAALVLGVLCEQTEIDVRRLVRELGGALESGAIPYRVVQR